MNDPDHVRGKPKDHGIVYGYWQWDRRDRSLIDVYQVISVILPDAGFKQEAFLEEDLLAVGVYPIVLNPPWFIFKLFPRSPLVIVKCQVGAGWGSIQDR